MSRVIGGRSPHVRKFTNLQVAWPYMLLSALLSSKANWIFILGKQSFVFQSPHGLGHGHGGYGGYGFGPWGHGHGYGNLGHIHPVPVTGVKALSVAYDPVSGVPYVCDPNKKADAKAGGAAAGGAAAKPPATAGKRSVTEEDEEKKDEIKVKIPDYPPCPDPKKSFPWSCICE